MWARLADVVSVPGPRFSLASDKAVSGWSPDRTNVLTRLGVVEDAFSCARASSQLVRAHYHRVRIKRHRRIAKRKICKTT